MMTDLPPESKCYGCKACANACPTDAINFDYSEHGYLYYRIDEELCIDCGKCTKVCPSLNPTFPNIRYPEFWAVCASDEVRAISSSGGMFTLLANYVLERDGVVFGAAFDEQMVLRHSSADTYEGIAPFRGSKYLQSDIGDTYAQAKKALKGGRWVLFTGTPCQIAGLYGVVGNKHEHLITADLLCHGTPSQLFFDKYLDDISNGNRSSVTDIAFRSKRWGWGWSHINTSFQNGSEHVGVNKGQNADPYIIAFNKNIMMRYTCYDCPFCGYPRQGDFTIGDLWHSDKLDPKSNDKLGTSFVFVNNQRSSAIFQQMLPEMKYANEIKLEESRYDSIPNRVKAKSWLNPRRRMFIDSIREKGFSESVDIAMNTYDIGLAGVFFGPNIGSVLTYFAFYHALKDMGYTVKPIERPLDAPLKAGDKAKRFIKRWIPDSDQPLQSASMADMIKDTSRFETLVVGSDQVFMKDMAERRSEIYLLQYAPSEKRKIAYASSFGGVGGRGGAAYNERLRYFLDRFDSVSCREDNGVSFANEQLGLKNSVKWVVDPVFLCDRKHYDEIADAAKGRPAVDFVASYIVRPRERVFRLVNEARTHFASTAPGFECAVDALQAQGKSLELLTFLNCHDSHPIEETVDMIRKCSFFVTDSYHGVCFSLIFRKDFLVIPRDFEDRFTSLLGRLGLLDRIIGTNQTELPDNAFSPIDYNTVGPKLDALIAESREVLVNALTYERETPPSSKIDEAQAQTTELMGRLDALLQHAKAL